jgi:hypothetical protein
MSIEGPSLDDYGDLVGVQWSLLRLKRTMIDELEVGLA